MTECSICHEDLADSPRAAPAHARKHKNEFERLVGRRPRNYDEVRQLLVDGELPENVDDGAVVGAHTTLEQFGGEA